MIASAQLTLPPRMFTDHRRRTADLERLAAAVRQIPGVTAAGITTNIPLQRPSFDSFSTVEGKPVLNPNDADNRAPRSDTFTPPSTSMKRR